MLAAAGEFLEAEIYNTQSCIFLINGFDNQSGSNLHAGPFGVSEEGGFERQMACNYYGHAYMALKLADLLLKSAPSRVVWTSSQAEQYGKLDWDNLK